MFLGGKRSPEGDQNWCVVLKAVGSEIDKRKVAQKMAQTFSLSSEEASDLVNNTPIILFDNLHRNVANKAKEFFDALGGEIVLTNDVLRKRKFYRTVWPEPPNLSFLMEWESPVIAGKAPEHVLAAEEAIHEMHSVPEEAPAKKQSPLSVAASSLNEDSFKKEVERWKQESQAFHHLMKDELDQLRTQWDEKISHVLQESQSWKQKFEEFARQYQTFVKDSQESRRSHENWEERYLHVEKQYQELQSKHLHALEELEARSRELFEMRSRLTRISTAPPEKEAANGVSQKEGELRRLVEEQKKVEAEIREREERIRKILSDQESIEKDILRDKGMSIPSW